MYKRLSFVFTLLAIAAGQLSASELDMAAAVIASDPHKVQTCLDQGADPNFQFGIAQETALMLAIRDMVGHLEAKDNFSFLKTFFSSMTRAAIGTTAAVSGSVLAGLALGAALMARLGIASQPEIATIDVAAATVRTVWRDPILAGRNAAVAVSSWWRGGGARAVVDRVAGAAVRFADAVPNARTQRTQEAMDRQAEARGIRAEERANRDGRAEGAAALAIAAPRLIAQASTFLGTPEARGYILYGLTLFGMVIAGGYVAYKGVKNGVFSGLKSVQAPLLWNTNRVAVNNDMEIVHMLLAMSTVDLSLQNAQGQTVQELLREFMLEHIENPEIYKRLRILDEWFTAKTMLLPSSKQGEVV